MTAVFGWLLAAVVFMAAVLIHATVSAACCSRRRCPCSANAPGACASARSDLPVRGGLAHEPGQG